MADFNNILKIRTNNLKPSKGKILISEPFLIDYYFKRSVVLLAEHNDEGSFGLIINKPVDLKLSEAIKNFPDFNTQVYLGGPVKTDSLYFIHTRGELIEDSMQILDGLYWGGDIEHVKELITIGKLQPDEIKFFIGYSGWISKQLEGELSRNSWLVANIKAEQVMQTDTEKLWTATVKQMGADYEYWTNFPLDPALN
ncbi:MAG: YqgE/AlgH family protein [Bacteroidales bacterium]|nr:YqgE/AlgH family protein [Bacteroidales bacterium]